MNQAGSSPIHFGTDGWRAVIDEDFNDENVARVADAAARVFAQDNPGGTIIIGYDTRRDAASYAALAASVVAAHGLTVLLSDKYCPTPTLCWSVARNEAATGGMMLTASHNPAEYLGIKLRMHDGGASPAEFTDRIEAALHDTAPTERGSYTTVDLVTPYLEDLTALVDRDSIAAADLRIVVDPLFGAGRGYLAETLRGLGVEVVEANGAEDPTFGGLHPEPIPPWIDHGARTLAALGFDAAFVTDGDADRIGAIDRFGRFVNPHQILALVIAHLVEDKGLSGRVIRTISGSTLIERQCNRLGLPLTTTPIGFKWIYAEMLAGDVLIGGEESGGIGIPSHVFERDGLLMSLLLTELIAQRGVGLDVLVDSMFDELGHLEYGRRDLRITSEQKTAFLSLIDTFDGSEVAGLSVADAWRGDGLKLTCTDGSWLLMRASGTEPLVRVYAEASDAKTRDALLDAGCVLAQGN